MERMLTRECEGREVEDYSGWPLPAKLELLAFDARLAGVPPALLSALWEAIDPLPGDHFDVMRTVAPLSAWRSGCLLRLHV
jgi:hypothetical protein